jgi:hypothetical protein
MGVGGQRQALTALLPGKRPGSHFTGGWLGNRAGMDGRGKCGPHRDLIPGRPAGSESGRSSIGSCSQIYVTNFINVCVSFLLFLRMNEFENLHFLHT